ncbi:LysR family transcriptional regulator [Sphingomonas aracearum]|uniref:LysR family transcriptional regulator n=1 Tax=Sphingomonas aracearum TaxID=2283317 RepID=A0A369W259_9SPHN|nr:LysR family transcriptional regulator [Sphingomonas aracearum]RDE07362.1 LysR family transcriptional regulator [Sphingomonas aracearum]
MTQLDTRKLRYFCAVAEDRGFHQAAERLHLSQPALTRAIQELEHELGARLFLRHPRGVDLTREGHVLYDHAHGILGALDAARDAVCSAEQAPRGHVSIGVPPSLGVRLLSPLAVRVDRELPEVRLGFHERLMADLVAMLEGDQLDIAVIGNPRAGTAFRLEPLCREQIYLAVAAEGRDMPAVVQLADLAEHPLIVSGGGPGLEGWFEALAPDRQIVQAIRFRTESLALSLALARAGLGSAVLPRSGILAELDQPGLRFARIADLSLDRHLATRKSRERNPATSAVARLLKEQFALLEDAGTFAER